MYRSETISLRNLTIKNEGAGFVKFESRNIIKTITTVPRKYSLFIGVSLAVTFFFLRYFAQRNLMLIKPLDGIPYSCTDLAAELGLDGACQQDMADLSSEMEYLNSLANFYSFLFLISVAFVVSLLLYPRIRDRQVAQPATTRFVATEIERLHLLRESGALSEEEFQDAKLKLLKDFHEK